MPNGSPIWAFDVADAYADLVGRASGKSETIQLSRSRPGRPISVDGGAGLQIRLATDPAELVADIRTIDGILSRDRRSELEYIDRIRPVQESEVVDRLDDDLESLLNGGTNEIGHRLSAVVPMDLTEQLEDIRSYKVKLGQGTRTVDEITLDGLLNHALVLRPGSKLQEFREGRVHAYNDEARTDLIGSTGDQLAGGPGRVTG